MAVAVADFVAVVAVAGFCCGRCQIQLIHVHAPCGGLWTGFVAAVAVAGFCCGRCQIHMTLMSLPRHLPGRHHTLCVGLKMKMDWLLNNGMGKGTWLFLLLVLPN